MAAATTVAAERTLHLAAEEGKAEEVEEMIKSGKDVNLKDTYGQLPLHYASVFGQEAVIGVLLREGADVNCETMNKTTPLHYAARNGHAGCVRMLLDARAQVDCRDRDGWTPLHYACFRGHAQTAELLIERGAALNERNALGHTPLHHACNKGFRDIACLLLARGADAAAEGKAGETPLSFLAATAAERQPLPQPTARARADALVEAIATLQHDTQLADVTLRPASAAGAEESSAAAAASADAVRAHKAILAARSPELRKAFADNPVVAEVTFADAGLAAVRRFATWCYTGAVLSAAEAHSDATELVELLAIAWRYCPGSDLFASCVAHVANAAVTSDVVRVFFERMVPSAADAEAMRPIFDHVVPAILHNNTPELIKMLLRIPHKPLAGIVSRLEVRSAVRGIEQPSKSVATAAAATAVPAVSSPVSTKDDFATSSPRSSTGGSAAQQPLKAGTAMLDLGIELPMDFSKKLQTSFGATNKATNPTLDTPLSLQDINVCKTFVDELMKDNLEGVNYFQTSSQWKSIPGYTNIVKTPMDLETVRRLLNTGKISTLRQFLNTVRRIWTNAYTFNLAGSLARQMADKFALSLENNVRARWGNKTPKRKSAASRPSATATVLSPPVSTAAAATSPVSSPPTMPSAKRERDSLGSPRQPPAPTPAPAPAPTTAEDDKPMSVPEMEALGRKIGSLDPRYLPQLLDMASCQTQDGELELDLSALKPDVLHKMERFVAGLPAAAFVSETLDEPDPKRQKQ